LKTAAITTLAAVTFISGCASAYTSKYEHLENRVNNEVLENVDGDRVGLDVIPEEVDYIRNDALRICGFSKVSGEYISIYEDVRKSNKNLLDDVKEDLENIININHESPVDHPKKTVYMTGIYDHRERDGDILELETININGDLYFTDPVNKSRIYAQRDYEFWNDSWWRWYADVHYPADFAPWWDPEIRGVFYHDYDNFLDRDYDNDGLTNWAERRMGTNPYNWDTDFDGLSDLTELWMGTNPRDSDTDNDGYLDGYDPYPLWHSRHHWNHNHHHWHHWWDMHYTYMNHRHKPIMKERHKIPGKVWKQKKDNREYKNKLRSEESNLRNKFETKKIEDRKYIRPNPRPVKDKPNREIDTHKRELKPQREIKPRTNREEEVIKPRTVKPKMHKPKVYKPKKKETKKSAVKPRLDNSSKKDSSKVKKDTKTGKKKR